MYPAGYVTQRESEAAGLDAGSTASSMAPTAAEAMHALTGLL